MTADDPFAPPEEIDVGLLGWSTDTWLTVAFALLLLPFAGCGALTALCGFAGVMGLFVDVPTEPGQPPLWIMGTLEACFFAVPTAGYGVAAFGVYTRAKFGWILGLLGFALWMGGCCMPFGLAGMYALLRPGGRKAFGM